MMHRWLTLLFCAAIASLSGCRGTESVATTFPTPVPGEITVLNARAPEALTSMVNGAVYFTLQNGTDHAIHLQMAEATVAARVSFHETITNNNVVRMIPQPDGFLIEPGESLVLSPGGKHLMLEELQIPLSVGDEFVLLLTFDGAGPMTLTIPVLARGDGGA